jgi:hypothetical protein
MDMATTQRKKGAMQMQAYHPRTRFVLEEMDRRLVEMIQERRDAKAASLERGRKIIRQEGRMPLPGLDAGLRTRIAQ